MTAGLWGLRRESIATYDGVLSQMPAVNAARIANVRSYVLTRDPSFFRKSGWGELPYPSPQRLAQLLDQPAIRSTLPASIRPPVAIQCDVRASAGFVADESATPPGPAPMRLATWRALNGSAIFRSEPFLTNHSRVTVFVAANGSSNGAQLRLVGGGGDVHAPLGKALGSDFHWKRVSFNAPAGEYRLEVSKSGDGWMAFTQPFTDTTISWLAVKTLLLAPWLIGIGTTAGVFAAGGLVISDLRRPVAVAPLESLGNG
jgi:hypothetical protein